MCSRSSRAPRRPLARRRRPGRWVGSRGLSALFRARCATRRRRGTRVPRPRTHAHRRRRERSRPSRTAHAAPRRPPRGPRGPGAHRRSGRGPRPGGAPAGGRGARALRLSPSAPCATLAPRPALLGPRCAPEPIGGEGGAALMALDLWTTGATTTGATLPDEATALDGSHTSSSTPRSRASSRVRPAPRRPACRARTRTSRGACSAGARAAAGARGARALAALDGRDDGVGLTPLIAGDARALPPRRRRLAELAVETRDDGPRLDDDPESPRASATRPRQDGRRARHRAARPAGLGAPPETRRRGVRRATLETRRPPRRREGSPRRSRPAARRARPSARLGLVETLAALGAPAAAPCGRRSTTGAPSSRAAGGLDGAATPA